MNYKKLKKIIKNLLKLVLQRSLSIATFMVDKLAMLEYILGKWNYKLSTKTPKSPISRGSETNPTYKEQQYIGDSYIGEHIRENTKTKVNVG